jgi:hypothetical protein
MCAMLAAEVFEVTRPMYSSINLGLLPAAAMRVGCGISVGIRKLRPPVLAPAFGCMNLEAESPSLTHELTHIRMGTDTVWAEFPAFLESSSEVRECHWGLAARELQ